MRRLAETLVAFVLVSATLIAIAFVFGITPDGLTGGQWADTHDHPTNWNDTAQHPLR